MIPPANWLRPVSPSVIRRGQFAGSATSLRKFGQFGTVGLLKSALLAATVRVIEEVSSAPVAMQRFEEIVGGVVVEAAKEIMRNGLAHELRGVQLVIAIRSDHR